MKKAKKVIALTLCAVMLVVGSVAGTLAYLQDQETVTNTFTVGNVAITLNETDVNLYGEPDGTTRVTSNEYKLLPGQTYTKDPMVTVEKGSEKSYVRMLVTITDFADVKAVFGDNFLPQNFVNGWDSTVWLTTGEIDVDENANTATYEFRYKEIVDARDAAVELDPLFDEIFIPGTVTGENLAKLEEMDIRVVAQAIQADNFTDAADAWSKFVAE